MNNGGTVTGSFGGGMVFLDSSTASSAVITNKGRGLDTASGGGGVFFAGSATADNATITNMPNGTPIGIVTGGDTKFDEGSKAGTSTITNEGATVSGQIGGGTNFYGNSDADRATIICNGGQIAGAGGGLVHFVESGKPGNATLIANEGVNGGDGGKIQIVGRPLNGGAPRVQLFGNGTLESGLSGATIGSLEGTGIVNVGNGISVGSNNFSTTFFGAIQGTGSLVKIGTGTLTLAGTNTYGPTAVENGTLIVTTTTGSTSITNVNVDKGTIGGTGIIPGSLLIGNGSLQKDAFLAPSVGTSKQATLTVQGGVVFATDATYTYTFKAKRGRSRTDLLIANGVQMGGTPTIDLQGSIQGILQTGLTLTVISNTSTDPISGTFNNLPDGAIIAIGGNNFQANYEGGDGNDLTLTVVP